MKLLRYLPMPDTLLTLSEVSNLFRVSEHTVRQWIHAGELRASQTPGGHWRIRQSAVDDLLERREITTTAETAQ